MRHIPSIVFVVVGAICSVIAVAQEVPDYIPAKQWNALSQWLKKRPSLRVATDTDCQCAENIAETRRGSGGVWKAKRNYHPYYAAGDFNGDGYEDFAVVLIDTTAKLHLAIFNGPLSADMAPAYESTKYVGALFFGPPRPKPYRLVVGEFGTEGGLLKPKGKSYVHVGSDCC